MPPRNFKGVYVCIKKKSGFETRWDPSPKNGASMALWSLAPIALELLTIACNVNLDWSIFHWVLMRVFNSLMASSLLLVSRFEDQATFMCTHHYLRLCTFSHSLRYTISPSPSMQLEIGAPYGVWCSAFFICWWHQPCCLFWGRWNFQVRTSVSWTVHLLPLFSLLPCLRWSSKFLTQREKCMHDLTQRTL